MRCLLLPAFTLLPLVALAQREPAWPRNAAGNIEFRGQLPWPDTVHTEAQRQTLARRWYRRGLTSNEPAGPQYLSSTGTTYAGLPAESCYQLQVSGPDFLHYRLCFQVQLAPDAASLRYRLLEFEAYENVLDAGSSAPLEEALQTPNATAQASLANFHQRLLVALKGW